ncbi:hypothetical protein [Mesorhizobium sp.]|uniref:hypothetical protein n=1 Tax=Mesorhizobium sp. TaxID=1871066 RepID=UPI0025C6CB0D|nr:hypothetical protein [Mesorhizobium sp.]
MDQKQLADAADVGINTIRNFEKWNDQIVRGRLDTMNNIYAALAKVGVVFLEDGQASTDGIGVRMVRKP